MSSAIQFDFRCSWVRNRCVSVGYWLWPLAQSSLQHQATVVIIVPVRDDLLTPAQFFCVLHYTWYRIPNLNQFTASERRDLCIAGFSLNFGLHSAVLTVNGCVYEGSALIRPSLKLAAFLFSGFYNDFKACASLMICFLFGVSLLSIFKCNSSTGTLLNDHECKGAHWKGQA